MAAEAHKVIRAPEPKPGAQEMSLARPAEVLDHIVRLLAPFPPGVRLEILREVERRIANSEGELIRKVTRASRGSYLIALPTSFVELAGTYKARIEAGKLILEHGGADARIRIYGGRLKLMLPKRLVEALGYPEYVRVRVEGSRIVVEPA